jgi:predicted PurR-regulated permease PerM
VNDRRTGRSGGTGAGSPFPAETAAPAPTHLRLEAFVYGSLLALMVGWVLYLGKGVFAPIVLAMLVVFVIVGLTRQLARIPVVGAALPLQLRYALAVIVAVGTLTLIAYIAIDNIDRVAARAPAYQASLLGTIQSLAARIGFESEPTWATLRQLVRDQVSIQALIGSTVAAAASILGGAIVVLLYVTFLLVERRSFAAKVDRLASDPRHAERIRQIVVDVNARVGSYLALKTLLGILQAFVSWLVMAWYGLEFATFWAMLIVLLNYIPYIGSFLSVFFPVAMAIVQFGDAGTIVALALALVVVQFAIGNFLDPYLLGNSLNLSPAAILVSLSVWSGLWGLSGAFLAVPITAVMAIVFSEFAATRPIAVLLSQKGTLSGD